MSDLVHPWYYEKNRLVCQYCKVAKKDYELLTGVARQSIDGRCIAFQTQHLKVEKNNLNQRIQQLDLFVWKAKKEME